jgi:hypothetical protein
MDPSSSHVHTYRLLGYLALAHAIAIFGLRFLLVSGGILDEWRLRVWVGLVTLWFLWPVALALHRERSALRLVIFVLLSVVLIFPSLRFYDMVAPVTFGLPPFVHMNPESAWKYYNAYRAGRAEAKKDIAAGILAIEEAGFGAGTGSRVRILRERYKIQIRGIAGCIVNETIVGHEAGYNSISRPEIDRRLGSARVAEAQEEGYKLDEEERAREEQYFGDLAKRFTTFTSDSKIALESMQTWMDGHWKIAPETEEDLGHVVRAVEKLIMERIPADAPPFELRVSATLTPTGGPKFETSAKPGAPQEIYLRIYNDLQNLTVPRWNEGRLSVALDFRIRAPR